MTTERTAAAADDALAVAAGEALRGQGWTVATAESCTGGLLTSWLTDVAGSSDYVLGGIVAYADEAKVKLLGVREATIEKHGAVSAACAREMAQGAQRQLGATIAVSITGIAGPGGATPSKPVGLTYIGAARGRDLIVERHNFAGERGEIKQAAAQAAMRLILRLAGDAPG
ncbi:MAG: CinA family protein [Chloroflexi bacterium]|nr:CinA family protein [Chloroflexota bacterium]